MSPDQQVRTSGREYARVCTDVHQRTIQASLNHLTHAVADEGAGVSLTGSDVLISEPELLDSNCGEGRSKDDDEWMMK